MNAERRSETGVNKEVMFHGYREWANKIRDNLVAEESDLWQIITPPEGEDYQPDDSMAHLYYGWSWMISKDMYEEHLCLILHPSPLPKYRGGSPIQNQLIAGEEESAVTILRVAQEVDSGEIYSQTPFSLDGTLDDIFDRIIEIGTRDTIEVLNKIARDELEGRQQDESEATVYRRRKPEQSEVIDFQEHTAEELHNLIRGLNDPYPNAYIVCKDGEKLYITDTHL